MDKNSWIKNSSVVVLLKIHWYGISSTSKKVHHSNRYGKEWKCIMGMQSILVRLFFCYLYYVKFYVLRKCEFISLKIILKIKDFFLIDDWMLRCSLPIKCLTPKLRNKTRSTYIACFVLPHKEPGFFGVAFVLIF